MATHKKWNLKTSSPVVPLLAADTGLTPLLAQLFINRGMADKDAVHSFLNLRLSDLSDPMLLKGMPEALNLIEQIIDQQQMVAIFGDYDADGITATALLVNFFHDLNIPVSYYIPNRLEEGYSLNNRAIERIRKEGCALLITVDCGSANGREIAFAHNLGMKVLVTDHHQVPDDFKPECPVINPHQPGCSFPFKDLAGVGVAFFLAVALRARLREKGWFHERSEPDLRAYLDFVAIGTVGDRVQIMGQNRLLVSAGLETMAQTRWTGIRALLDVAEIKNGSVTAEDLAFRMAPRLNAPGRIGDSSIGIDALTSDDPDFTKTLAIRINGANIDRQGLEQGIYEQIEHMLDLDKDILAGKILVLGDKQWHKGVLGIVASKLVEKYYRPTLIYNIENGLAVGSGRSIDGFDLFECLSECRHLLERFGGHSHAAGFTLKTENLPAFEKELESLASKMFLNMDLTPVIHVDVVVPLKDISTDFIDEIRTLAPFGEGNPEPVFAAEGLVVLESRVVGDNHLKLRVRQEEKGRAFDAIGFNLAHCYPYKGSIIDMLFVPEINHWRDRKRIQLRMTDVKYSGNK